MMKLSPILIAAAVAFGGNALAQSRDTDTKVERAGERAAANTREAGRDAADATRRGTQRAADATRRGTDRAADKTRDERTADRTRSGQRSAARTADEPSMTDKAKRGAQRAADATRSGAKKAASATSNVARGAADKMRSTGQAIEQRLPPAPATAGRDLGGSDTRAMGAGPSSASTASANNGDRRQRMDDAYANYRRNQGQR